MQHAPYGAKAALTEINGRRLVPQRDDRGRAQASLAPEPSEVLSLRQCIARDSSRFPSSGERIRRASCMNATGNHRPLEPLDAAGVGTWAWQIGARHITLSPHAVMLLGGTAANYTDFLELIRAPERDAVALALSSSHASREGF